LHPFVISFRSNYLKQYDVVLSLALRQLVSNDFLRQYGVALTLALHQLVSDRIPERHPSARFDLSTMRPFVRTLRFLVCANLLLGGNAYFLMGGVGTLKYDRIDPIAQNLALGSHAHHIMGSSAFSLIRPTSEELRAATCTSMPIVEDTSSYWHPLVGRFIALTEAYTSYRSISRIQMAAFYMSMAALSSTIKLVLKVMPLYLIDCLGSRSHEPKLPRELLSDLGRQRASRL
jgi:hypothetical protein